MCSTEDVLLLLVLISLDRRHRVLKGTSPSPSTCSTPQCFWLCFVFLHLGICLSVIFTEAPMTMRAWFRPSSTCTTTSPFVLFCAILPLAAIIADRSRFDCCFHLGCFFSIARFLLVHHYFFIFLFTSRAFNTLLAGVLTICHIPQATVTMFYWNIVSSHPCDLHAVWRFFHFFFNRSVLVLHFGKCCFSFYCLR